MTVSSDHLAFNWEILLMATVLSAAGVLKRTKSVRLAEKVLDFESGSALSHMSRLGTVTAIAGTFA